MRADLKLQDSNKDKMVGNIFSELVNEDQYDENAVVLLENSISLDSNLMQNCDCFVSFVFLI